MNMHIIQNTKKVEEYIEYIRERIIAAANNWKEIAEAFAEAKEMYGMDSDTFKRLCKETKFSISKASKLATIARSERLTKYRNELAAVQSWTVLYAITTLSDDQFQALLKDRIYGVSNYEKAEVISMGMVNKARNNEKEISSLRVYATVYVEIDALRGQVMGGQNIADLEEHLRNIQITVPYIKVVKSQIERKQESSYMAALHTAFETVQRKNFNAAITKKLKKAHKQPWETKDDFEIRVLGDRREDMLQLFVHDAEEALRMVMDEYDVSELWNEAQDIVNKKTNKVAENLHARCAAFEHANAAIQEMKDDAEATALIEEDLKRMFDKNYYKYYRGNKDMFKDFK